MEQAVGSRLDAERSHGIGRSLQRISLSESRELICLPLDARLPPPE
jgi:hypothetical protein